MSSSIAGAAEQQSVTAEQINRSITNIDKMTKETAIAAQKTSSASDGLTHMASDLKAAVAHFIA
jgi:methyl-accepting chemotaxis protein